MASWPNNFRAFTGPGRTIGNLAYAKYTGTGGGRLDIFTSGSAKTASHPDGYGMIGGAIQPLTAGGMSSYNTPVQTSDFTGNVLSGGPISGTADVVTLTGNNMVMSLVVGMNGTSTITLTGDNCLLSLTIGLSGNGTWTLEGDNNALSLIVPFEGSGSFGITGVSDLKGRLSMSGEWTPYTELSPENLAKAVWESILAQYPDAGTAGKALNSVGASADPWSSELPGTYTGDQAGAIIQKIKNNAGLIPALL